MTKQPWWRSRIVWRRIGVVAAAVILVVSAGITANERWGWFASIPTWDRWYSLAGFTDPPVPADELRVTVLDVGDADSLLIQSGEESLLVDAGEPEDGAAVLDAVYAAGIQQLSYMLATHYDTDHIGGMATVLHGIAVERVVLPSTNAGQLPSHSSYAALMDAIKTTDSGILWASYGTQLFVGNARVEVISGRQTALLDGSNENSLVCRLTFGNHTFLLMGDVNADGERRLMHGGIPLKADVIKLAHHGSNTSSDPLFIQAVQPTYAVVTCDSPSRYGYPHPDTLKTMEDCGVTVFSTGELGSIVFESDGTQLCVKNSRGDVLG